MLTCPMCKKRLRGLEKECLNCKADVSLLVSYVENLREGLTRAEGFTRAGKLGEAVWAYLEVLEVDPDNATARQQVGSVATAVRQFDETAPGRRWLTRLHKQKRFRRWMAAWSEDDNSAGWLGAGLWFIVVLGAMLVGYMIGVTKIEVPSPDTAGQKMEDKEKEKKPHEEKKGADGLDKP